MTKITIITCIIAAVCVFKTTEAGLLDPKSMVNSVLGNIQKEIISNPLGSIKDLEDKVKNGLQETQKELQTPVCNKAIQEGQKALDKLINSFQSCVLNETDSASGDVEKFTDALDELKTNLLKEMQKASTCLQDPLNIVPCLSDIQKDYPELKSNINAVIEAAHKLIEFFPKVGVCYQNAVYAVEQDLTDLVKDGQECIKSIFPFF